MHHFTRVGCFNDEADVGAFFRADQVMMNARAGQKRWDGSVVAVGIPVRENDICIALVYFFFHTDA